MLPDRLYNWLETLGWIISSMIVGAMWGWFIAITKRELLFYISLGLGAIWFIRLYRRSRPASFAPPLSTTTSALAPRSQVTTLQTITPSYSPPAPPKNEILSPVEAREWLDDFLRQQQQVEDK